MNELIWTVMAKSLLKKCLSQSPQMSTVGNCTGNSPSLTELRAAGACGPTPPTSTAPASRVCIRQFGPHAEFDGVNTCVCRNGTIPDVNGTCIEGSEPACEAQFGPLATFDARNNTCVCERGAVPDFNGTCVAASTELCQEWCGPGAVLFGI